MRWKSQKVVNNCLVAGEETKGGELAAEKNGNKKEIESKVF
jgi:hypothetical protein